MKLSKKFFFIPLLALLLFVASEAQAAEINNESEFSIYGQFMEKINSFDASIKINEDSSINVKETIEYDFGDLERHGIFRFIPFKYKARGGNFTLRFSEIKAEDENGNPYNYQVTTKGSNKNIKIGDADIFISGVHTYVISYKVEKALNYFEDWDELYWNVTGTQWTVPILSSSATVELPAESKREDLKYQCFTGAYGSNVENCEVRTVSNNKVEYKSQVEFGPDEGMTIVLGWPKNIVSAPTLLQKTGWAVKDNLSLFIAPLVFIFTFLYWWKSGRDPKIKKAIIAEYEPPDNLSPIELATLIKDRISNKYISAQLIKLAVEGYIKIKQTGTGKKDYQLIYLKDKDYKKLENSYDRKLLEYIFDGKEKIEIKDLENKFYRHLHEIKNLVYNSLAEKGYYVKNPQRARFGFLFIAGIIVFFLSFILGPIFASFMLGSSLFLSGVIMMIFSIFMSKKSAKGVEVLRKIYGFEEFLRVTEKERLKFHNPPDMVPELFEKYLPYAMSLGVENDWAKNFENIYKEKPDWYEGYQPGTWGALYLATSLSDFSSRSSSILASAPSSSASGGSGFSGGGVGGGGGGGGGGSW